LIGDYVEASLEPCDTVASPFARERGRVRVVDGNVRGPEAKPLTLILSPCSRGEAKKTGW